MTNYRLMQVKSIAECFKGSILQYFRPSLSYHLLLRSLFCLFFEWPFYTGFTGKSCIVLLHMFVHKIQDLNCSQIVVLI